MVVILCILNVDQTLLYVTLSHLIVTTSPWGRYYDPPHFAESSNQTFSSVC